MGTISTCRDRFLLVPPHLKPLGPTAKGQVDVNSSTVAVATQTHKLTGPDFLQKAYCTQLFWMPEFSVALGRNPKFLASWLL